MDSRLLNIVYDDPFDGNYIKYNDTDFWSSGNESMGMQLTETLNGILPIAPTEDFHKDDNSNTINTQNCKNALNYEEFCGEHLLTGGAIEIVTVDPNSHCYESEDEEDSDDDNDNINLLDIERQSQCSNATFRTRTDSSSIGDYESHTSDYDDEDEDDDDDEVDENILANNTSLIHNAVSKGKHSGQDLHSNLLAPDGLFLDTSHNSDVDGLGLHIDANNFDLAEFITKDDFQLHNTSSISAQKYAAPKENLKDNCPKSIGQNPSLAEAFTSKNIDSASDSDIIVDVETVEMDEDEYNCLRKASEILKPSSVQQDTLIAKKVDTHFVDNVRTDPTWSPSSRTKKEENLKLEEKSPLHKPNFTRNFLMVPNKKQCDLLKGKLTKGKAKALQKPTKVPAAKSIKIKNSSIKQTSTKLNSNSAAKPENSIKIAIEREGKHFALVKNKRISNTEQSSENKTPVKRNSSPKEQKPETAHRKKEETSTQRAQAVKRILNLEEYKKRRGCEYNAVACSSQLSAKKSLGLENKTSNCQNNHDKKSHVNIAPMKHSEAVTSIVRTLKEQQSLGGKTVTDPITEAKNKVLRMQELKKAQQMRIIDSTISAKVPRVTKVLPLREIVKDSPYINKEESRSLIYQSTKSEYEEIIIVSASCNTDISMPPTPNPAMQPVNKVTRSLLKSSALLSTITNTFEKVKATSHTTLSTNSLIVSIQDVVVKKSLPVVQGVTGKDIKDGKKVEHHGEDKIIMHLRKDRIRKCMCSISTQTDLQPEFPPLALLKPSIQPKYRERTSRHRKRQYRKQASSSSSEISDDQSIYSNTSSISPSRDNSCSSSLERMRTYDSAIGTGGYSSRSSFKHRSSISSSYSESTDRMARGRRQRRTSYTKRSAARRRSCSSYSSSSYTSNSDRSRSPYYRRSRSRSTSRTRSRSRSRRSSYRNSQKRGNKFVDRNISQPAVEERRIVYVGRIEQETTKDILRRKFLQYGTIKQISIHFKDTGMKYGFVTFEHSEDAFAAIDNSTRDPQINMYDVSFGGRRAFCRSSYADLDNAGINTYHSYVFPKPVQQPKEEDSFEVLLMKMKAKLNENKTNTITKPKNGSRVTAANCRNNASNKI